MEKLDETIKDFMSVTAKSTIAVIIPLYGFWGDIPDNPINGDVLKVALDRLYSNVHHLYLIFVGNPQTIPSDMSDPSSVANILLSKSKMGNVQNIPVPRNATYNEYVKEGMDFAIHETNAQFMVVFNPWTMIQEHSLDMIVDRANRADEAKVISGYDVRSILEPENFDVYRNNMPNEEFDFSFNFVAMPRFMAEMISVDVNYKTHVFAQRDIWQQVAQQGFAVISTQKIPIFPFDFPWKDYETKEQFNEDGETFRKKWGFNPGITYEDPTGEARKDKQGNR
jgi:hypothetical protein